MCLFINREKFGYIGYVVTYHYNIMSINKENKKIKYKDYDNNH